MQHEKISATESPSLEKFDINFLADPDDDNAIEVAYDWKIRKVWEDSVMLEREITSGIRKQTTISKERLFQYNPLLKEDEDFLRIFQEQEMKS